MSKKTLNKANLEKLGADELAALVQGSAALQRRARMELSAAQGPADVAADLRKRFVSLRRSTSYIDWRKQLSSSMYPSFAIISSRRRRATHAGRASGATHLPSWWVMVPLSWSGGLRRSEFGLVLH
jgi:hypothetical protein